jgi:3-oxoacyl-(acyl-carrier-protein) synthase
MTGALRAADVAPADVGCVLADGSAVPREDSSEVLAISAALGSSVDSVPVTAAKPTIGHLMGAATVGDAAVALRVLATGEIPPIANLDTPAAGFGLDFVVGAPRTAPNLSSVVINARGLGGVNGCLVLTR